MHKRQNDLIMVLADLYFEDEETLAIDELYFNAENQKKINQFLREYKHIKVLRSYQLPVNNKLLLHGHTGCGKTTTAKAIAKALDKKIVVVNLGAIVSSKLGETAKNMAAIFKKINYQKSVLLLDEFDSLGKIREYDNKDSGEMKRVVNTIIQLIDYLTPEAIIIAATNQINLIDTALLRRFELKIEYTLPNNELLDSYYDNLSSKYPNKFINFKRQYDISFAEAQVLTINSVKENIIVDLEKETI